VRPKGDRSSLAVVRSASTDQPEEDE
jgi:hypothetical protein